MSNEKEQRKLRSKAQKLALGRARANAFHLELYKHGYVSGKELGEVYGEWKDGEEFTKQAVSQAATGKDVPLRYDLLEYVRQHPRITPLTEKELPREGDLWV